MTYNTYCPDYPEPEETTEEPVIWCTECGGGIYEGDLYWNFLGHILCGNCINNHKMIAEV